MSVETSTGPSCDSDGPVTVKATPTATLDAIVKTLVSEKPQVQEHAIAQAQADAAAAQGRDIDGNPFNPAIHASNADGSPRKTLRGAFSLKRGKKPGTNQTATAGQKPAAVKGIVLPGTTSTASAKEQEARAAGVGAANLVMTLFQGLGGQEWSPRFDEKTGLNEKAMMEHAHADAFASWGWADLPPGLALAAAYAMYMLPRLSMPQTKTRVQRFRGWIGAKIGAWRATRKARSRGIPESDVERADREARQQYAREKANG